MYINTKLDVINNIFLVRQLCKVVKFTNIEKSVNNSLVYNFSYIETKISVGEILKKKIKIKTKSAFNLNALTKRQKKKLKLSKMKKLVRPSSRLFYKFKKYPRNIDIFTGIVGKKGLVHDGYSWHLITFNKSLLAFKIGSLCFRTRVVSPVKIYEKGKDGLEMSQQNTYRIRHIKVRRKK